jgi:hypothetical protein
MLEDDKLMRLSEKGVRDIWALVDKAINHRHEEIAAFSKGVEESEHYW